MTETLSPGTRAGGRGTCLEWVFGPLDVTWLEFGVCCLAAGAGAAVQGVLGFGYALLVVPALLVVAPAAVPTAALVVGMPLVLILAVGERDAAELASVRRLTLGRVPGTALAALFLRIASPTLIAGAAGALLLLAVAVSLVRGAGRASNGLEVGAGFLSGLAGTIGAIGGPYLGLAVVDRPARVMRATVSAAYAFGLGLSGLAVLLAGGLHAASVALGAALVPATLVGLPVGRRHAGRLEGERLRAVVLLGAGAAGVFAVVRAVAVG